MLFTAISEITKTAVYNDNGEKKLEIILKFRIAAKSSTWCCSYNFLPACYVIYVICFHENN